MIFKDSRCNPRVKVSSVENTQTARKTLSLFLLSSRIIRLRSARKFFHRLHFVTRLVFLTFESFAQRGDSLKYLYLNNSLARGSCFKSPFFVSRTDKTKKKRINLRVIVWRVYITPLITG